MSFQIVIIILLVIASQLSSSSNTSSLNKGESLSAPQDALTSYPNRNFTAGFYAVGDNAYCFAIWFTQRLTDEGNHTVVWMANRDRPINGEKSKLSLLKSGNLVLNDAGQTEVWSTQTSSDSPVHLHLYDNGNLVLQDQENTTTLWQSFDSPTDTLLPQQPITRDSKLVSARSLTNHSSGFYQLLFDADNVLRLLYDGFGLTSVFWPSPWQLPWAAGRSTYNSTKMAILDPLGHFRSSDDFKFNTIDHGELIPRIMRLDSDGNLRVYSSLDKENKIWKVTWQASSQPCAIHGICGLNSLCNYIDHSGTRKCSCLPGHRAKNKTDWSYGCEPEFNSSCDANFTDFQFLELTHVEFYGYDFGYKSNKTLDECKQICLSDCRCRGFQYKLDDDDGINKCFPKAILFNGYRSPGFNNTSYVKVPQKAGFLNDVSSDLQCDDDDDDDVVVLGTYYRTKEQKTWVKSFAWFTCAVGVFEILCLITYWIKTRRSAEETMQAGYRKIAERFQKFRYVEMKKATRNFSEEIGRGSSGVVYKGKLSDNRIAAIKRLHKESHHQGEEEFLAEVGIIGNLNHMNLIEIWGYCAEGKHRLLVYEYMENGSLAKNLEANKLDWEARYEIAVGTAKGLAYLHEECLEWVLHCDVKPQNILLGSDFNPKVIDFGLSKLLKRDVDGSKFSRIRGTRGYMAPEWIYNLPITCKVDVYSYGMVLLEMITGKSPLGFHGEEESNMVEQRRFVSWVREKMNGVCENAGWVEEIVDGGLDGKYDLNRMEVLVDVALKCSEEDRDARPTMSQVVHMLLPKIDD